MGGPNSPAIPPCACASEVDAIQQASTAILMRHTRRSTAKDRLLTNLALLALLAMLISEGLQVPPYRPDREITTNELADPVASDGQCAAERERDVLGLSEEAAQRAPLDQS